MAPKGAGFCAAAVGRFQRSGSHKKAPGCAGLKSMPQEFATLFHPNFDSLEPARSSFAQSKKPIQCGGIGLGDRVSRDEAIDAIAEGEPFINLGFGHSWAVCGKTISTTTIIKQTV